MGNGEQKKRLYPQPLTVWVTIRNGDDSACRRDIAALPPVTGGQGERKDREGKTINGGTSQQTRLFFRKEREGL